MNPTTKEVKLNLNQPIMESLIVADSVDSIDGEGDAKAEDDGLFGW